MNDDLQRLIDDFLDGNTDDQAVARLDELVRKDPSFRLRLLRSAAMEDGMRQLVGTCKTFSLPERRRTLTGWFGGSPARWVAAAAIVAAVSGWGAAVLAWQGGKQARNDLASARIEVSRLGDDLLAARTEVSRLGDGLLASRAYATGLNKELLACKDKVAKLETELVAQATRPDDGAQPRVLQYRGLAMMLPVEKSDKPTVLRRDSNVVYNRTLWTCPWGGLDMAYRDGTSVSLDRNSEAVLSQADEGRHIQVHKGIIYLTRRGLDNDKGPVSIETPHGTVEVEDAQIALAISGNQTTVEIAAGRAKIIDPRGEETVVEAGHYAVVRPDAEVRPVKGRLEWRLEPMKAAERKGG